MKVPMDPTGLSWFSPCFGKPFHINPGLWPATLRSWRPARVPRASMVCLFGRLEWILDWDNRHSDVATHKRKTTNCSLYYLDVNISHIHFLSVDVFQKIVGVFGLANVICWQDHKILWLSPCDSTLSNAPTADAAHNQTSLGNHLAKL